MTRAVVAGPTTASGLGIETVPAPVPAANEAVVAVSAFSLNAGEVRDALGSPITVRPGWDLAGVVEGAAADGSGYAAGTRVVGFAGITGGGWAEHVAVPTVNLAEVPDDISFAHAACLPVAGLTALYALEKGGSLLGKSVLVTGASGGVGLFACQLAIASGATVVGSVRRPEHAGLLAAHGVGDFVLADEPLSRRFDLILESVGGASLARSLAGLQVGGCCVVYGNSTQNPTTFQPRDFYHPGAASIYGFFLGTEVRYRSVSSGLGRLLTLVGDGRLTVPVEVEASWRELPEIARRYRDREITGKAVLHIDDRG